MYDCVQSVYELQLLPNNTLLRVKHFKKNRGRCEVMTGYLSLGRRPGGYWANMSHWTKRSTIPEINRLTKYPRENQMNIRFPVHGQL